MTEKPEPDRPGIRQIAYSVGEPATAHATLAATEYHVRTGEAVAQELSRLHRHDRPDAILGHVGWGGMLFAKDAMPGVPLIGYCEYFYNASGSDLDVVRVRAQTQQAPRRAPGSQSQALHQRAPLEGVPGKTGRTGGPSR